MQVADADGILDDLVRALRNVAISNELYYAEHEFFSAAMEELQSMFDWAPDSVGLTVELGEGAQPRGPGLSAVAAAFSICVMVAVTRRSMT